MTYQPGDLLLRKYRIEALVGQGAFGQVYRATHLELQVLRALKVLRRDTPGMGSCEYNDFRERFRLEARLGARLDHPHVIKVYDFEEAEGELVLVMEYAPGGSLADQLSQARQESKSLPVIDALRIAQQTALGLAALHDLDVVHRDVKPSNILFGADGRAKLADLGLAQTPESRFAREGQGSLGFMHPGTPEYMPPEQMPGRTTALRASADVYALGCVLFEMLTGRMYFHQRPGTRPAEVRVGLPNYVDDLISEMVADEIRERPWNGDEAAKLLAVCLDQIVSGVIEVAPHQQAEKDVDGSIATQKQSTVKKEDHRESGHRQETVPVIGIQSSVVVQESIKEEVSDSLRVQEKGNLLVVTLAEGVELALVRVPTGTFLMGSQDGPGSSDNEKLQHKVHLEEFWIGKYPVTNCQYEIFVAATHYHEPYHWENGKLPEGKAEHPVANVSWYDACAFCEWASRASGLKLRLPTEAEWEKAARGTDGRKYPWGDQAPDRKRCNYYKIIGGSITRVGRYSPRGDSPYGCADMAGNVYEWTSSLFYAYPYRAGDGREDLNKNDNRVLRGGAWISPPDFLRSAQRNRDYPDAKNDYTGFRCARSP